jgi:hypothetical protein
VRVVRRAALYSHGFSGIRGERELDKCMSSTLGLKQYRGERRAPPRPTTHDAARDSWASTTAPVQHGCRRAWFGCDAGWPTAQMLASMHMRIPWLSYQRRFCRPSCMLRRLQPMGGAVASSASADPPGHFSGAARRVNRAGETETLTVVVTCPLGRLSLVSTCGLLNQPWKCRPRNCCAV